MRFSTFRISPKKICSALFCSVLCIAAIAVTLNVWCSTDTTYQYGRYSVSSMTDVKSAGESYVNTENPDYIGDVGGEFVAESDSYDGELTVPAHISLDRIVITESLCKPLEYARVSSLFGYRQNPVTGKYSFHSGYDLAAPHGANIYAMYDGKVTTASYDSGYGNYIILTHKNGFQTLYAHCSKLLCESGDSIDAGDVIALVGSTGNSTGAHLHVEFRKDGQRFDPEWILGGIY